MNEHCSELTDSKLTGQIKWLFPLIESLINQLSGLGDFRLDENDKQALRHFLQTKEQDSLQQFLTTTDPDTKQELTISLIQTGVKFIEESIHYRQQREKRKQEQFVEECRINNVPLDYMRNLPAPTLQPSDCAALQDWPGNRNYANGTSGRLENAGQFIQRLFEEKRYDEGVYGELYLSDLKHINPQLYQALTKWQSRNNKKLLKTKREEIDQLLTTEDADLNFYQASQVRNARWRRQQQTSPR